MGYYFGANRAAWTFFVIVYTSVNAASGDHTLITDLGLDNLPDKAKINISLEEYTTAISSFLKLKDDTFDPIPDLRVYNLDKLLEEHPKRKHLKMVFSISASPNTVESATLRLLLPPQHSDSTVITVRLNQILGARRRKFVQEETFYLSENLTKWCEIDVTKAVSSWMKGRRNLGLELECVGCSNNLKPKVAAITALIQNAQNRTKRDAEKSEMREGDCVEGGIYNNPQGRQKKKKVKCCRHPMRVEFKKLGYPNLRNVQEPFSYDAGYCQGLCPPDYSVATNHSRIQGLLHKYTKRDAKQTGNKTNVVPKTCCTPSKLTDLDVLIIDSQNPTKLKVEKWTNMIIEECACS